MTAGNSITRREATVSRSGFVGTAIARRLAAFDAGSISLELPNGRTIVHAGSRGGPDAVIRVTRWRFLWRLAAEGEVGLGRSYVDGDWSSPDLSRVFAYGLANVTPLTAKAGGLNIAHLFNALRHWGNANSRRGSRRNIMSHYDLGNDFYRHWLDADYNYYSGIAVSASDTLEEAQARKLERIVELLELTGDEDILEIGCGWGAMARRLAGEGIASFKGITLSAEQLAHAVDAAKNVPASSRLAFELQDYRDVAGKFDRIVSIEMLEAVGEAYWHVYFAKLRSCLREGGTCVLQVITIADKVFESYRRRPDFIQQYIFPGGMLPTVAVVAREAERAGFSVVHHQDFGASYAHTLDAWHTRFQFAWPELQKLGFDERFRRMWDYYLKYCAEGFRSGQIDVGLFKLTTRTEPKPFK